MEELDFDKIDEEIEELNNFLESLYVEEDPSTYFWNDTTGEA